MSDRIVIRGIRGFGYHGVLPQERKSGQEFLVDIEVATSLTKSAHSDDLSDTVNYATLAQIALEHIEGQPCNLLETVAEAIGQQCLSIDGVEKVCVTIHKPQAPIGIPFMDVAVTRCLP